MILEDFYVEVLQKLGVLAAEENPTASDRLAAKDKYEQVHAELERRDIINWFDDEDVPDWAADAFATIVADRLSSKFSLSSQAKVDLAGDAVGALTTIVADGQRREPPDCTTEFY